MSIIHLSVLPSPACANIGGAGAQLCKVEACIAAAAKVAVVEGALLSLGRHAVAASAHIWLAFLVAAEVEPLVAAPTLGDGRRRRRAIAAGCLEPIQARASHVLVARGPVLVVASVARTAPQLVVGRARRTGRGRTSHTAAHVGLALSGG